MLDWSPDPWSVLRVVVLEIPNRPFHNKEPHNTLIEELYAVGKLWNCESRKICPIFHYSICCRWTPPTAFSENAPGKEFPFFFYISCIPATKMDAVIEAGWLAEDHQSWMQKKNGQKSRLLYPLSPFLCLIWLIDTWGKRERGERRRKNSFSHPKECNFSFLPLFSTSCSSLLFSHSRQQKKNNKVREIEDLLKRQSSRKKVNPRMIL